MYQDELYVDKNGFLRTRGNNTIIGELAVDLNGRRCLVIKKPQANKFDAIPLSECIKTLVDCIEKKPKVLNQKKFNCNSSKNQEENTK